MEDLQPLFGQNQECHLCKNKFITMNADRNLLRSIGMILTFVPFTRKIQ